MSVVKEIPFWKQFEYQVCDFHRTKYQHSVWHNDAIPEDHLENAGIIHDYNKHRLSRIQRKHDDKSKNRSKPRTFEENLEAWIKAYRENGNKPLSQHSENPQHKKAGQWQQHMRKAYNNENKDRKISQERIDTLNATEGWTWNDDPFEENLEAWKKAYRENGNKPPSRTSKNPEHKKSGQWQNNMRTAYKNKKISQERINALNATEGWTWNRK